MERFDLAKIDKNTYVTPENSVLAKIKCGDIEFKFEHAKNSYQVKFKLNNQECVISKHSTNNFYHFHTDSQKYDSQHLPMNKEEELTEIQAKNKLYKLLKNFTIT